MTIIWAAAVDHRHGTGLFAAQTEAGIFAALAAYCRQSWQADGPGGVDEIEPAADLTDREIVAAYFDFQSEHGNEWYVVEEVPLAMKAPPEKASVGDLLSRCRTAITDQWDEDHEETIKLVRQLGDVLSAMVDEPGET